MDALYFRVSSDRQTAQNQFEDLLQIAEKDGSGRDWDKIRQALADCIYEEQLSGSDGATRAAYRLRAEAAGELAERCVYVEQGRSGKRGTGPRPLFELMKRDAAERRFDRLLVWKVSRLGRDMREVIAAVYELADLGVTVIPLKSQTGPINSTMGRYSGPSKRGTPRWKTTSDQSLFEPAMRERVRVVSRSADRGAYLIVNEWSSCAIRKSDLGQQSPGSSGPE
jgi:DNA invertase Pin-like site-specific DNA recombinase